MVLEPWLPLHFTPMQDVCICDQRSLQSAYNSADAAANALHLTVAGSFVM